MSSPAEVLARAFYDRIFGSSTDARISPGDTLHDALKAHGYAVVKLPEAHPVEVVSIDMEPEDVDGNQLGRSELTITFRDIPRPGRLFNRRELAAALLAAANAAESGSTTPETKEN